MMAFRETILNALGHAPDHMEPGRLVRFATSDRRGDRSGWARLFEDGEGGVFGCWRTGFNDVWQARQPRSDKERQAWLATVRRNRDRVEQETAELRAKCRKKSAELWSLAREVDAQHPYVVAKGITPQGAKQLRNSLLIPVRGAEGVLCGLQFIDSNGAKKFKTGTEVAGNYQSIGKPKDKTLLVCEGWATGCTLHEVTGYAVAVAFNAGNLLPVCKVLRAKYPDWKLVIVADDDHGTPGNPGVAKATTAAKAVDGLLAVPDFTGAERTPKDTDANDLACLKGTAEVRLCIERAVSRKLEGLSAKESTIESGSGSEGDMAERPMLFDENYTPDIPPELLPSWLGEFTEAVSCNTQTPPAMAALLGLAAVATAVAKRFDVAPHDSGYSEPLNLWTATALPPGSRKTAVVSAMTGPLIEWERAETERLGPEIRRVAAKRHALEKRKEKLAKDAANADSQERLEEILQKIERVEGETPEELCAPRLWTGDTTPERLQSLLVDHGERMAVLTDEGGIFEVMAGLYSGGSANLDIFLQGHAGRAVRVDRQGRTAHLDAPALTFGLAVQPEILAELASGGKRRFRGNGTLARFLFAVPRSNIGQRDVRAVHHIPQEVVKRYRDGFFDLLAISPQIIEGREVARRLTLTLDALDSWQAFAEMIERRQGEDGDLEPIQDWSAKLPGAALRIAGTFHLVQHGSKPPAEIETATVERALDLCALLIEHARTAFGMMEGASSTGDAKAIFRWITEERLCRFRKGVAYRQFKGRFTGKPERFAKALQELEERAIISTVKEKTSGRAATVFLVNPVLWKEQP